MRLFTLSFTVVVYLVSIGCQSDYRTVNDELRAQLMELEREVIRLVRENQELQGQVRRATATEALPEGAAAQIPQVAELVFARFSHARDTTGDGLPDELRIYLHTLDGRGKFVQATGELTLDALLLPTDPSVEPIPIGHVSLDAQSLRESLRSGFTGMHYTVRVPLTLPDDASDFTSSGPVRMFVRAALIDVVTGLQHTADRTLDVRQ